MKFYTYVLSRPDSTPFYVGKGTGKRYLAFNSKHHCNQYAQRIYNKIVASGAKVGLTILPATDEAAAFAEERRLIALYGRLDLGTGTLCNHTDGGEGPANPGPATRAKLSVALLRPEVQAKIKAAIQQNPEGQAKKAAAMRGENNPMKRSEIKAKHDALMRGDNNPMKRAEIRAKHKAAMSFMKRLEVRAKVSASMKIAWQHMRGRISGENNPAKRPEVRKKLSAAACNREQHKARDVFDIDSLPEAK